VKLSDGAERAFVERCSEAYEQPPPRTRHARMACDGTPVADHLGNGLGARDEELTSGFSSRQTLKRNSTTSPSCMT
jgi:hypothetical protein